ncbi:peptidyl-prolyl cis-trans isomerase [Bdellovibrio bacteriovorus]|uniref:peptidylprolyl isomerase n=1 Tax=Bdellovibrio bacteriovorus (strain ATCC 15356 / DSM 50701 / NCIMB 9529 / HD100) TaxID=264462 RepID=Q6MRQ6_BDEBA|nr:peptidyl-prolyl cis-trans isomerase [Bdellovibrio bacteriovorus]AHZ85678.1 parvulin peptidyl-prolyl isomerase [Bdellovibrio bacteriovorus]BEV66597.1 Foldase protein PrsA [Bdellovibrio bacteriovorus]CAE77701.1 Parvulin-like peptidyl-prolyl isomerase [Bdellovibrio bacteriovorus HD100]
MKFSKSPALTGLFIFMSLALAGCPSSYQKLSTKPVEKVNDHVLTSKQFANQLARRLRNFDALAAKDPNNIHRIKEEILRDFLVKSLTLDWARAQSIVISENTLDKEVDKLRANYPDDLSFRRALALENLSFSEWREELRYSLVEREVFKKINEKVKAPTEEEIKRYYEDNKDRYKRKERVFLRQIVVDEDAKADAIKVDLKTGDFAELARKYSITPEAKQGGVVGWIEKGTVDYFDPLFNVGSGVQTIKSPFGIHLIRVEKKAPASTLSLEEVKPQIIRALRAQREQAEYVAWLDAQLRSSKVLKDYELMNSIKVDTRGTND